MKIKLIPLLSLGCILGFAYNKIISHYKTTLARLGIMVCRKYGRRRGKLIFRYSVSYSADEIQVSDIYVRLGNGFETCVAAFQRYRIGTR